jgi:hypothetical protein
MSFALFVILRLHFVNLRAAEGAKKINIAIFFSNSKNNTIFLEISEILQHPIRRTR